jgi:hypothetical protein
MRDDGILRTKQRSEISTRLYPAPKCARPSSDEDDDYREVPHGDVERSFAYLRRCTYEFEERMAIMQNDSGLTSEIAEREAGVIELFDKNSNTPMLKIIHEELTLLRRMSTFAATITELTRPTILSEWNIGLSSDGAVLFWYVDRTGRFRNAKKIWYGSDGWNRLRDGKHNPRFLYPGYPIPLYGEWQLNSNERRPVALVESEKSALVLGCYMPDLVVLAAGGSKALTERRAGALRGRTVNIFFDRDEAGEHGSEQARRILSKIGAYPKIVNLKDLYPDAPNGYDAGDILREQIQLGIIRQHGQSQHN